MWRLRATPLTQKGHHSGHQQTHTLTLSLTSDTHAQCTAQARVARETAHVCAASAQVCGSRAVRRVFGPSFLVGPPAVPRPFVHEDVRCTFAYFLSQRGEVGCGRVPGTGAVVDGTILARGISTTERHFRMRGTAGRTEVQRANIYLDMSDCAGAVLPWTPPFPLMVETAQRVIAARTGGFLLFKRVAVEHSTRQWTFVSRATSVAPRSLF